MILESARGYDGKTTVEWIFTPHSVGTTFVDVTERGFHGDGDTIVKNALGSTGGLTWCLAGANAWLEHGIKLNLVADRFPKGK